MSRDDKYERAKLAADKAANRLHHLSMRYSGAIVELVAQQPVGLLAKGHPGLSHTRDLIDLILLTRAEINGLTRLLLDAGLIDPTKMVRRFAEEYEWFAQEKAKHLGVGLTDYGITFNIGPKPEGN